MSLVVRPFLEKKHNGAVAKEFRPLGPNGEALSADHIFKIVFLDVGRAYFGVENLDIYLYVADLADDVGVPWLERSGTRSYAREYG